MGKQVLTLKVARELVKREFGTAVGLKRDEACSVPVYVMQLGSLSVRVGIARTFGFPKCIYVCVHHSWLGRSLMTFYDADTLDRDFKAEDSYYSEYKNDLIEDWVSTYGPSACHARIDQLASEDN